jgi:ATP adenylyltransferase/5',5'''-P-1,P-4-tetraphosphate phosphorylase II
VEKTPQPWRGLKKYFLKLKCQHPYVSFDDNLLKLCLADQFLPSKNLNGGLKLSPFTLPLLCLRSEAVTGS